jgi:hypothetical protein
MWMFSLVFVSKGETSDYENLYQKTVDFNTQTKSLIFKIICIFLIQKTLNSNFKLTVIMYFWLLMRSFF